MNIRMYNARILTMNDGADIIQNGELHVCDNIITYVGEKAAFNSEIQWNREIDCKRNLLMPGFKNAHTHSPMTFLRSKADDMPLDRWLNEQVFPYEAKLTFEYMYEFTKLAILEYISGGITGIFDMYINPDAVAKACEELGMRCVLAGAVNDFTQSAEIMEEMYLKYNRDKNSLISYIFGFHAEYTTSETILKDIAVLSHKYKAPVYTHLAETSKEVRSCIKHTQMTPTGYLNTLGIFDNGGGAYHCVHMTDEDIQIFKDKSLYVVTNPASNLKLASGIAPINRYIKENIPVAIGTDGAASNNCLDMFREMFLTTALAKYRENDASVVDANEVLKMATVNGARAMSLNESDTLKAGKKADIIMIDLNKPNMYPLNNITKNLVYSGNKMNVKMTMINGKILYEDGKYNIGTDVEQIYKNVQKITEMIFEKINM